MEYATLNNGVKMPMAGIGTFLLTPDEAEASCVSALQNGYRLIDTANAYCNEKAVGRAMKKSGLLREEIFLETKLWPTFYTDADAVDKTLARLDTDYIDLLLIHQPFADYYGTYRAMEKAVRAGKVRAIGVSNFYPDRFVDLAENVEIKPAVNQLKTNVFSQQWDSEREMEQYGTKIMAWAPIAQADADLFERIENTTFEALRTDTDLLSDAVSAAIRVKADIVERDEYESGDRRKLNLGHTLAHAIEKCSNRMNHGEAVAVGTALIAGAAVKLGVLTEADRDRIVHLLMQLGFDLTPPVEVKRLLKEVGKDKKNEDGMLRIVLPVGIGDCEVRPIEMDAFAALFI